MSNVQPPSNNAQEIEHVGDSNDSFSQFSNQTPQQSSGLQTGAAPNNQNGLKNGQGQLISTVISSSSSSFLPSQLQSLMSIKDQEIAETRKRSRTRSKNFTVEEDRKIAEATSKYTVSKTVNSKLKSEVDWDKVYQELKNSLSGRTKEQIKSRYTRIIKKQPPPRKADEENSNEQLGTNSDQLKPSKNAESSATSHKRKHESDEFSEEDAGGLGVVPPPLKKQKNDSSCVRKEGENWTGEQEQNVENNENNGTNASSSSSSPTSSPIPQDANTNTNTNTNTNNNNMITSMQLQIQQAISTADQNNRMFEAEQNNSSSINKMLTTGDVITPSSASTDRSHVKPDDFFPDSSTADSVDDQQLGGAMPVQQQQQQEKTSVASLQTQIPEKRRERIPPERTDKESSSGASAASLQAQSSSQPTITGFLNQQTRNVPTLCDKNLSAELQQQQQNLKNYTQLQEELEKNKQRSSDLEAELKKSTEMISGFQAKQKALQERISLLESNYESLKVKNHALTEELKGKTAEIDAKSKKILELEGDIIKNKTKVIETLKPLIIEKAQIERIQSREIFRKRCKEIGSLELDRTAPVGMLSQVCETWKPGEKFDEMERDTINLHKEKESLEKQKKQVSKQISKYKTELRKTIGVSQGDASGNQPTIAGASSSMISNPTSSLQINTVPSSPNPLKSKNLDVTSVSTDSVPLEFSESTMDTINDLLEEEEIIKLRLQKLKKEEENLIKEKARLNIEKNKQMKEFKRIKNEEMSQFNNFPIHQDRYILMSLIGKGGFSEVFKAYDLAEMRVVACKIHQLNPNWNDSRRENYIKHVLRESKIHQSIKHKRIVQLFDTFILDNNTFVTVLEFCGGSDLDMLIKTQHMVPEKEARSIMSQVFSGLKHLNSPARNYPNSSDVFKQPALPGQQSSSNDSKGIGKIQKIIHFDLKPANILFSDSGEVKITDFGLSKIMESEQGDDPTSIELTSQGAGTYYYLAPECFETPSSIQSSSGQGNQATGNGASSTDSGAPHISSKVDVWSAGVIFFQMIYGKKPFGNEMTQQEILSSKAIVKAKEVIFPPKPVISDEAKDFIKLCLTHDQRQRPDVLTICQHPYLRAGADEFKKKFLSGKTVTKGPTAVGTAVVIPTSSKKSSASSSGQAPPSSPSTARNFSKSVPSDDEFI